MSKCFTWLGVQLAVLVIAGMGCQLDGDGAMAGSSDSVFHGAPSGSASTVMLYALDPSPGVGSYRDEGVIPFLIATAVVVGPHHAISVAHVTPAFDAVNDVEVFLADAPEFEKGTFQGEEYLLITNHDESRRVGYWMSFSESLQAIPAGSTSVALSQDTMPGDDLMVLVLQDDQRAFAGQQIAALRRPQDGDPSPPAGAAQCGFIGVGFGWPNHHKRQYNACFVSPDEPQDDATPKPLYMVYPNNSGFATPPSVHHNGAACEGDSGGPVYDGQSRVIGLYSGSLDPECSFPADPNHLEIVTNTALAPNWSAIERVRRLCRPSDTAAECQKLIDEPSCGNLGAIAGFEETDLQCLPAGTPKPGDTWVVIKGATDCEVCVGMQWLGD